MKNETKTVECDKKNCNNQVEMYLSSKDNKWRHSGHVDGLCDTCAEYYYCECGQALEDSYGSPGDGFCIRCR